MLTKRYWLTLFILAAGIIGLTWWLERSPSRLPLPPIGVPLIQGLDVGNIGKIVITTSVSGKPFTTTTLQAGSPNGFVVTEKNNYPADNDDVNELLRTLLAIRTAEVLASDAQGEGDFNLGEATHCAITTKLVQFFDHADQEILTLKVGAPYKSGNRVAVDAGLYVSAAPIDISGEPITYISPILWQLDRRNLRSLTLERADGEVLTLTPNADGVIGLHSASPVNPPINAEAIWNLHETLMNLSFVDLTMAENLPPPRFTAQIMMNTEGVYEVKGYKMGADDYRVTVAATAAATANEATQTAVQNFNHLHENRLYTLDAATIKALEANLAVDGGAQ